MQHDRERATREADPSVGTHVDAGAEGLGWNLVRTALEGACVLDEDHRVVECNDAFAELLGSTRGVVLARSPAPLCPLSNAPSVRIEGAPKDSEWPAGLTRGSTWTGEGRLKRLDGESTYVEFRVHRSTSARVLDYCFVRNVSKRRAGDPTDQDHFDALAQVSSRSTLGEMASGIAHEFNQPLAAIVNYANGCVRILEQRGEGDETIFRGLRAIADQGKRAAEVIRRLRAFTRRAEQNREPFLVSDLITDALDLSAQRLMRAGVRVSTSFHSADDRVVVDGIQIEQVLMNLFLNATEVLTQQRTSAAGSLLEDDLDAALTGFATARTAADPSGPRLRIETHDWDAQTHDRDAEAAPGFVAITVADSGDGIPEETQNRVFEPFYSGTARGLGLGLTIAQSIVESHGGRMWIERDGAQIPDGFATAFRFTLPRQNGPMSG